MTSYIVQRTIFAFLTLFGVLLVVFVLIRVSEGDPAVLLAGPDANQETIEATRKAYGLDRPLPVQFGVYLRNAAQLDFGRSFHWRQSAFPLVVSRIPPTAKVAALAFVFSLLLGVPVGTYAAYRRGTVSDFLARSFALAGQAMPTYWLGLMLILLFSVRWHVFPTSGTGGIRYLVLPAITLGWFTTAATVRLLRSAMIEVLEQDYIAVAHSKGLRPSTVLRRHALRNAVIPVVTLLGLQVAYLLSGSALVETVFAIPGIGQLAVQAVFYRDYPVVQATVVVTAMILITSNLVVDLAYGLIDPRIRIESGRS